MSSQKSPVEKSIYNSKPAKEMRRVFSSSAINKARLLHSKTPSPTVSLTSSLSCTNLQHMASNSPLSINQRNLSQMRLLVPSVDSPSKHVTVEMSQLRNALSCSPQFPMMKEACSPSESSFTQPCDRRYTFDRYPRERASSSEMPFDLPPIDLDAAKDSVSSTDEYISEGVGRSLMENVCMKYSVWSVSIESVSGDKKTVALWRFVRGKRFVEVKLEHLRIPGMKKNVTVFANGEIAQIYTHPPLPSPISHTSTVMIPGNPPFFCDVRVRGAKQSPRDQDVFGFSYMLFIESVPFWRARLIWCKSRLKSEILDLKIRHPPSSDQQFWKSYDTSPKWNRTDSLQIRRVSMFQPPVNECKTEWRFVLSNDFVHCIEFSQRYRVGKTPLSSNIYVNGKKLELKNHNEFRFIINNDNSTFNSDSKTECMIVNEIQSDGHLNCYLLIRGIEFDVYTRASDLDVLNEIHRELSDLESEKMPSQPAANIFQAGTILQELKKTS